MTEHIMREVDENSFFDFLRNDPRDIMPRIVSSWDETTGYTSHWLTKDRILFGESKSGNGHSRNERYWIVEEELKRKVGEHEQVR